MSERSPPSQPVEAGVIPIRSDPFASKFNRECGEPGILSDVAGGLGSAAKGFKYIPMPITGRDHCCIGLLHQHAAESEDIIQRAWNFEYARVRANANYAGQYLRRNAIGRRTIDRRFQPRFVLKVIVGIRAKSVNQDVDVTEYQSWTSKRSSRLALSLRSTPAIRPPPARHSGSATIERSDRLRGRRKAS